MPDPPAHDVTSVLEAIAAGKSGASDQLFPLVYQELRRLARAQMARERHAQTLQPTALVHEAYIRLVGPGDVKWNSRGHFFSAAALAMRRILVESARRRRQLKRGGDKGRVELDEADAVYEPDNIDVLALDEALAHLEARDKRKAEVVMLRYFGGLSVEETAAAMDLSPATIKNEWAYAKAWLFREMTKGDTPAT
jgi:RNA polymerase sigma factor (TIGR02999 family)